MDQGYGGDQTFRMSNDMDNPFNAGDLAMLKSGSVPMTIVGLDGDKVFLAHENSAGDLVHATFPACCLVVLENDKPKADDPRPLFRIRPLEWTCLESLPEKWIAPALGADFVITADLMKKWRAYGNRHSAQPVGPWDTAEEGVKATDEWYAKWLADNFLDAAE